MLLISSSGAAVRYICAQLVHVSGRSVMAAIWMQRDRGRNKLVACIPVSLSKAILCKSRFRETFLLAFRRTMRGV